MIVTRFRHVTLWAVSLSLVVSLSGCGTLFYPERKGQLPGRIDPGVAIVDGLGLLLFIVPGVIAYAIDFSNNTIYLPGTHDASAEPVSYRGDLDEAQLADLIEAHTGRSVGWHTEVVRLDADQRPAQTLAAVARFDARVRGEGGIADT